MFSDCHLKYTENGSLVIPAGHCLFVSILTNGQTLFTADGVFMCLVILYSDMRQN